MTEAAGQGLRYLKVEVQKRIRKCLRRVSEHHGYVIQWKNDREKNRYSINSMYRLTRPGLPPGPAVLAGDDRV